MLAQRHPGFARDSNVTDKVLGYVYWQTCQWLVEAQLAYWSDESTRKICLTPDGVTLAKAEGLL